jgi:hypothetical protein
LETTELENCSFVKCKFSQIRVYTSSKLSAVRFNECTVDALRFVERDVEVWDPPSIRTSLEDLGVMFAVTETLFDAVHPLHAVDSRVQDVEKLMRYFLRSTHISESVILMKLGGRGQSFIDDSLPMLIDSAALMEIENRGGSVQRRFKLAIPLQAVNTALAAAQGSFTRFLELCKNSARSG